MKTLDLADRAKLGTLPADPEDEAVPIVRGAKADQESKRMSKDPIRLGPDVHRVVDECVAVVASDQAIYQRDGQLVHVVRTPESEADALTLAGTPQIRPLLLATLVERLTRHATFERFDRRSEEWIETTPPTAVVSALAARGQWRGVRPIVGVIEAPSMRPDGTIMQTIGYDAATGYLYEPNDEFPQIAEAPTHDDARSALAALAEPFADFPFASEANRAVALSAVLTIVGRAAVAGNVPAAISDASTPGTGKTLSSDVIATIATGRPTSKMGYPANDEEVEKVLGAYALRGAHLIHFDNVTRPFGGGPIDRCLTAGDSVELRVLGRSEIPSLRWRAVILATGNNVELQGDTARRVVIARQESPLENPEERTGFRHSDLLGWVRQARPKLVAAALTLLRAYVVAGRPNVGTKRWGSFESWSDLIPAAMVWAGAADPMGARPTIDAGREPEKMALSALVRGIQRLGAGVGVTAKEIADRLYSTEQLRGHAPPDGFDDLREAIETLTKTPAGKAPTAAKLGYVLRRFRDRVIGGRMLTGDADRNGVVRWSVSAAGDAGHAGHVPTLRVEDGRDGTSQGPGGETSPASPSSPADGRAAE